MHSVFKEKGSDFWDFPQNLKRILIRERSAPIVKWTIQVGRSYGATRETNTEYGYCPGMVFINQAMGVKVQDLGTSLSFALSALEKTTSSQANQHCKGIVQGLNEKMHLPMNPTKVQSGELKWKSSWPKPIENTESPGECWNWTLAEPDCLN